MREDWMISTTPFDAPITTAEVIALPASLMVAGYVRMISMQ
jgi:hypothetical protein